MKEGSYYAEASKEFKDKKSNYQELMLAKLEFMNSQSEKVQALAEEYEGLESDHRQCQDETR